MIGLPNGTRVWLARGLTDLRNEFDGLAELVQTQLAKDTFSGQFSVSRRWSDIAGCATIVIW